MKEVKEVNETVYEWHQLPDQMKKLCVTVHALGLRVSGDHVNRLFELGRPKIVFADDQSYCRIHTDSVSVMQIIIDNYLRER